MITPHSHSVLFRAHREKWRGRSAAREGERTFALRTRPLCHFHSAVFLALRHAWKMLAIHRREGQGRSRERNFPTRYALYPPEQPVLQAKIRISCQYSHFSALFWRKECEVLRAAPQLTGRLEVARCPKTAVHNDYLQS